MSESNRISLPTTGENDTTAPSWDRRGFLVGAGAAVVALVMPGSPGEALQAQRAAYPRRRIGLVTRLRRDTPVLFRYPWDHENCTSILLKLNTPAAGGVGPDRDIVAFNRLCTHMGRVMREGDFNTEKGIGYCNRHWTTFDLTRHGMVISGHAPEGLPQVMLEVVEDEIFSVAVQCLIFGMHDNRVQPGR